MIDLTSRYIAAFGTSIVNNGPGLPYSQFKFDLYTEDKSGFEDVVIRYENKELNFGTKSFLKSDSGQGNSIFAPPPMVGFSRDKELIITKLNGDGVEVVERWNNNSWDIKMQGILVDMKNHHYPTNDVEQLVRLFNYNNVLEISGTLFYEKGIDFMYIQSVDISGVEGFADTVRFSINARSIKDLGFKLNE